MSESELASTVFYSAMADAYGEVSRRRERYLRAIDARVNSFISTLGSTTILDVGTGDGRRLCELLSRSSRGATRLVADGVEPSPGMRRLAVQAPCLRKIYSSIREVESSPGYGAALLLWNVLGHAEPGDLLPHIYRVLEPNGYVVLDVNMRYNFRQYGARSVTQNLAKDVIRRRGKAAIVFEAAFRGESCPVWLHTARSLRHELLVAGFVLEHSAFFDYESGQQRRSQFSGQYLAIARRA